RNYTTVTPGAVFRTHSRCHPGVGTKTDPTLQGYRDRAGQGLDANRNDRIEWEEGLLYRYTEREGSRKKQVPQKQMVVPQGPRQELL
uniref:Uncharacterized protein n=1 Tax=Leptobrachium leishanense TaxID=445787 RepID=A0A8C5WKI2_9ANUR